MALHSILRDEGHLLLVFGITDLPAGFRDLPLAGFAVILQYVQREGSGREGCVGDYAVDVGGEGVLERFPSSS